jgi:hypothetical protein
VIKKVINILTAREAGSLSFIGRHKLIKMMNKILSKIQAALQNFCARPSDNDGSGFGESKIVSEKNVFLI